MEICSKELEGAGEKIMKRVPYEQVGQHFITTSTAMEQLSKIFQQLSYVTSSSSSTSSSNKESDNNTPPTKATTGFFASFLNNNDKEEDNKSGGDPTAAREAVLLASQKMLEASIQMKYAGRTLQGLPIISSSPRSFLQNK